MSHSQIFKNITGFKYLKHMATNLELVERQIKCKNRCYTHLLASDESYT